MLPIKLNNVSYNFPTQLSEISLKQFFALRNANGLIDEICALTGMERQTIQNFKERADLEKCRLLLNTIGDKLTGGINGTKLPKHTTIDSKIVKVPANLKLEPVGAFIAVHNLITEEHKNAAANNQPFDPTNIIPQVLAHYFWLPYMGSDALYSDECIESEDYIHKINTIPVTDAIPIANFFFRKYPNL
ncbi:hypothetical protein KXQ82_09010 [Mucilaginibacter sp. HMF5004]|uniref:hypothetical protein n=1 Tax=Mucilaginibacter rivuli TaxID=2857527 RepID=UPI001C5DB2F6|nr:hypothetical protein [Mucilaginibacter rivuli]MBW4889854.1 hypothetical protein [Mucilaginibacter rivuli]